jgi:hypothetical protein
LLDLLGLESSFASGFAPGVAYYLKSDIPSSSVLGVALGITLGLSLGRALGLSSGLSSGLQRCIPSCVLLVLWGYPLGVLSALLLGALLTVPSGTPFQSGVLLGVLLGVASGILLGDMSGIRLGDMSGVMSGILLGVLSGVLSALLLALLWTLRSASLVLLLGVGLLVLLVYRRRSFALPRSDLPHFRKRVREVQESYHQLHFSACRSLASRDNSTVPDHLVVISGISCLTIGRSLESEQDIRNYFKKRLTEISAERNLDLDSWLSEEELDKLARISCGQFIFASTALRFIDNPDSPLRSSVEIILSHRPAVSSPYPDLDSLYTEILERQPEKRQEVLDRRSCLIGNVLGAPSFRRR